MVESVEFSTFYTVIDADTFTLFSGFENENTQRIAFACGMFFSACILMVSLLQLKLLYSHRTSFPLVFIVLGVVIFSSDILYLYFSEIASGEDASSEGSRGITRSISGLIIWTIYMLVSNRVKTTFIRRRKNRNQSPSRLHCPCRSRVLQNASRPSLAFWRTRLLLDSWYNFTDTPARDAHALSPPSLFLPLAAEEVLTSAAQVANFPENDRGSSPPFPWRQW